jgi:CP family cyanate transporter-like MFS transporter
VIVLTLIAIGTVLRSLAPSPSLILTATLPIGIGIALIGVTLPVVVKEYFPERGGAITGAYVASPPQESR